jgi:putative oxidoreductase
MKRFLESLFILGTGCTYTNMARLFIRLFVGIMMFQFGVRHIINYDILRETFPPVLGMTSVTSLTVMICIEIGCSVFTMLGLFTRLSVLPQMVAMILAEHYILFSMLSDTDTYAITWNQPGYLPLMFIGIYIYMLLAGPGKISLDYFITLYIVSKHGKDDTQVKELEEV